jgi:hypothetical protein
VPRTLLALCLLASLPVSLHAQTIDDGVMLTKGVLFSGTLYSHQSWDKYWEGELERTNGNVGTVTTQTNTRYINYGLADRINVIASVPYIRTKASQGVLHPVDGLQDLTVAAGSPPSNTSRIAPACCARLPSSRDSAHRLQRRAAAAASPASGRPLDARHNAVTFPPRSSPTPRESRRSAKPPSPPGGHGLRRRRGIS